MRLSSFLKNISSHHLLTSGNVDAFSKGTIRTLNALEIIMLSGVIHLNPLLGSKAPPVTRFVSIETPDVLIKRMTDILCKMPVIFTTFEKQAIINIQAPFENSMIVIIIQVYKTEGTVCIVDVKKWKGDESEFKRIYKTINERLGNIIIR